MATMPLCVPINNGTLLPQWPGPPLLTFLAGCGAVSLLLPQPVSSPTAVPSLGPLGKPHSLAPSPPPHQETHNSGWDVQDCNTVYIGLSLSCHPQTSYCISLIP